MICPDCGENVQTSNMERHRRICASKGATSENVPSEGARAVRAYRDILEGTRPGDIIYLEDCPNILHDIDGRLKLLEYPNYQLPA